MLQKSDYEAGVYSYDETLGVKRMRKGEYPLDVPIDRILHYMDKHHIQYIIHGDGQCDTKIEAISAKPYILYFQGNREVLHLPLLAIVGPRNMSSYAKHVLDDLFPILSGYNIGTISGAATGVDTYVHELSLRYAIPTVAVLGGGLAYYQQTSQRVFLSSLVQAGGLLISEYPLRKKPEPYTFPARNRIIAGLASVVFVPEAGEKSGSLITVDFAHQRKKPIYAPMGDIFSPSSFGTNTAIEQCIITPLQTVGSFLGKHFPLKGGLLPQKISPPTPESKPTYASPSEMFVATSLAELGL